MFRCCTSAILVAFGLMIAASAAHTQAGPVAPPPLRQTATTGEGCLNRQEQRLAVVQGRAIRLLFAMRAIRPHDGDELVRAELCRRQSGMVYVLTLLSRNGKVSRAVVDARNGTVIKDR
jgi:hypothetical protein